MKNFNLKALTAVSLVLSFAFIGAFAEASDKTSGQSAGQAKASDTMAKQLKGRLSTTMAFSGSRVKGQYQVPAEATARIENEKPLEELMGLRTQFRDRMSQDEERTSERQ